MLSGACILHSNLNKACCCWSALLFGEPCEACRCCGLGSGLFRTCLVQQGMMLRACKQQMNMNIVSIYLPADCWGEMMNNVCIPFWRARCSD
jgi:hypothetical protein